MDIYHKNIETILNKTIEDLEPLIEITMQKIREFSEEDNNKLRANFVKLNNYRDVICKIHNITNHLKNY